jgi:hypothetical protein
MADAFKLYDAVLEMLTEDDPILERSSAFRRVQENLLHTYKELYQQKKKRAVQMCLDHFKQEEKIAPQKTPENYPATTPTKTSGYCQGAPLSPSDGKTDSPASLSE